MKKSDDQKYHHGMDKSVNTGSQNDGSAKTMSGGNKRGNMGGGKRSMGIKPRDNYPGGMGNS